MKQRRKDKQNNSLQSKKRKTKNIRIFHNHVALEVIFVPDTINDDSST
jgi:hypothetical protein